MARALVIGMGGIGTAVAALMAEQGYEVSVVSSQSRVTYPQIDMAQLPQFCQAGLPDCVVCTVGMLHNPSQQPEKNIHQLTVAQLLESVRVNAGYAVEVAQALSSSMDRRSAVKYLVLSARVGSISDNVMGGWYSYRASKAALNMLIKTIAIEWRRAFPQASIAAYHPGTVATSLSAPFSSRVAADALFSPDQAAGYLMTVLSQLTPARSGELIDWRGDTVSY